MAECVRCGHDPEAFVLGRWTFQIALEVESLNAHRVNAGARWLQAAYRKRRDAWHWEFKAARRRLNIDDATGKRRVSLVRVMGPKQRAFDEDNLAGGCKMIVDAMVLEGLLRGDKRADVEVNYDQQRGAKPGLLVTIEELA